MRILDLFCGAGGCAMGYHRAGFEVVGVDINPQPNYPFQFFQGDALEFGKVYGWHFDAIHASPPCQHWSVITPLSGKPDEHPDLIAPTRILLKKSGKPWVIENVVGAPLENPITLCGSSFGLRVRRHRLFESSIPLRTLACHHKEQGEVIGVYGHAGWSSKRDDKGRKASTAGWKGAMEIDWMNGRELAQAIPPAYTEYIGRQLLEHLETKANTAA